MKNMVPVIAIIGIVAIVITEMIVMHSGWSVLLFFILNIEWESGTND